MTLFRFENISLFKLDSGDILGLHNNKLEVARMSSSLWDAAQNNVEGEELSELKSWSNSSLDITKKLKITLKTKTLTINTTQLCNLKCTYCAAGGDGTYGSPQQRLNLKIGLPQIEWLMTRCLPGDRFQINFIGGEPLLYPEIINEIANYASQLAEKNELALRLSVITNGTRLFDSHALDILIKHRIAVLVSVDGPPQIQNKFRPKKNVSTSESNLGSSQDLERGLFKLRSVRDKLPSIGLAAVFHKDHYDVLETYKYFLVWDFDYYEFSYSHTDFDIDSSRKFSLALENTAEHAISIGGEDELRKIKIFDSIFNRFDEQLRIENFCGSGKSLLSMDSKGDLFACPWDINISATKLNKKGIGLNQDSLTQYESSQISKNECQTCWAKFICGGGCNYSHQKSPHERQDDKSYNRKVDPVFCERMQSLIVTTIKHYESFRRGVT